MRFFLTTGSWTLFNPTLLRSVLFLAEAVMSKLGRVRELIDYPNLTGKNHRIAYFVEGDLSCVPAKLFWEAIDAMVDCETEEERERN